MWRQGLDLSLGVRGSLWKNLVLGGTRSNLKFARLTLAVLLEEGLEDGKCEVGRSQRGLLNLPEVVNIKTCVRTVFEKLQNPGSGVWGALHTVVPSAWIPPGTGDSLHYEPTKPFLSYPLPLSFPVTTLKVVVPPLPILSHGFQTEEIEHLTGGGCEHGGSFGGPQLKSGKRNQRLYHTLCVKGWREEIKCQIPSALGSSLECPLSSTSFGTKHTTKNRPGF